MPVDVLQQRQTECDETFGSTADAGPIVQRSQDVVDTALEEIVLVAKMRVERRAANVGAIENLLHDDRRIRLFPGKTDQRCVQRRFRPLHAPVAPAGGRFRTICA